MLVRRRGRWRGGRPSHDRRSERPPASRVGVPAAGSARISRMTVRPIVDHRRARAPPSGPAGRGVRRPASASSSPTCSRPWTPPTASVSPHPRSASACASSPGRWTTTTTCRRAAPGQPVRQPEQAGVGSPTLTKRPRAACRCRARASRSSGARRATVTGFDSEGNEISSRRPAGSPGACSTSTTTSTVSSTSTGSTTGGARRRARRSRTTAGASRAAAGCPASTPTRSVTTSPDDHDL